MKLKVLSVVVVIFFVGMVCMGTCALAGPEGDPLKPPRLGKDGKPVKYTDEEGDWYWGTDGHLYPWPPPVKIPKKKKDYIKKGPLGWYGAIEGVGFGGVSVKEKSPKEIRREMEERMRKYRKEQRRKARENKRKRKRERELKRRAREEEED
ncbi:MAG: hypothetical protein ACE5JK_03915 [Candidatus Omnitrophota bacterium]